MHMTLFSLIKQSITFISYLDFSLYEHACLCFLMFEMTLFSLPFFFYLIKHTCRCFDFWEVAVVNIDAPRTDWFLK